MPTFGLHLRHPETGETRYERLQLDGGDDRARAAHAGEIMQPGFQTVAVTVRHEVRGRCAACNAVVFTDQPAEEGRDGLRCFDCA